MSDVRNAVSYTHLDVYKRQIYLIAVSSIVLTIVLCLCFQNGAFIFFTWLFVFFIFPTILLKLGIAVSAHFKTDFIYNIAMWITADSMKARGYGLPGRTSFTLFKFQTREWDGLPVIRIIVLCQYTVLLTGSPLVMVEGVTPGNHVDGVVVEHFQLRSKL